MVAPLLHPAPPPGLVRVEVSLSGAKHRVPGVCLCRRRALVLTALHSLGPEVKPGDKLLVHAAAPQGACRLCFSVL